MLRHPSLLSLICVYAKWSVTVVLSYQYSVLMNLGKLKSCGEIHTSKLVNFITLINTKNMSKIKLSSQVL